MVGLNGKTKTEKPLMRFIDNKKTEFAKNKWSGKL